MTDNQLDQMYQQAIEAGKNRNYSEAVQLFTKVSVYIERFPHALLYLGRSYHALGEFTKAVQILEFYVNAQGDSEPGHFFLARSYLALNNHRAAKYHFKLVLDKNSAFFPALSLLGLIYLRERQTEKAVFFLQKAHEIDPSNVKIFNGYLNALLIKAIRLFRKADYQGSQEIFAFLAKHKKDSILTHIYLARIHRELGNHEKSIEHYNKALELSPDDPVLPMLKAVVHLAGADYTAALDELKRAGKLMDSAQGNLYNLKDPVLLQKIIAVTLFREKRFAQAIESAKIVLRSNYKDPDLHAIVGECYYNLEEYTKAKNHFTRSMEIDKSNLQYRYGLLMSLWKLEEYTELERTIKGIQRINPQDQTAAYFYALNLAERGTSPQDIITNLQNTIRVLGPDISLMFYLGKAYLENGMADLSVKWFERTLTLEPDHKHALLYLIEAFFQLDSRTKLNEAAVAYLKLFPKDRHIRQFLIRRLMEDSKYGQAVPHILYLLSEEPHNKGYKKNLAYCYLKTDKFQESALIYRELLKDEPLSINLLRALIFCLDGMKTYQAAINILEKAKSFFKQKIDILLPLGVLYSKIEDFEKAQQVFREIIGLDGREWRAYYNMGVLYKRQKQTDMADSFLDRAESYKKEQIKSVPR